MASSDTSILAFSLGPQLMPIFHPQTGRRCGYRHLPTLTFTRDPELLISFKVQQLGTQGAGLCTRANIYFEVIFEGHFRPQAGTTIQINPKQ